MLQAGRVQAPARVMTLDHLVQSRAWNLGVQGGGGQVSVAQQILYRAQVSSPLIQMGGESPSQRVRGQQRHVGPHRVFLDAQAQGAVAQRSRC